MRRLGTCTICEAACGIVVDLDGDRIKSVRGDTDDPVSRGYVCPKVVAMQDLHEDADRLRKPLVRRPGTKAFQEASWEEAMAFAAEGLRRVRREHGKDALGVYQGNPVAHNLGLMTVGQIVLRTLGTKNLYSASTADQVPHMRAAHEMFGHLIFMPVPDIDRTAYWLVVGANPMVSNGSVMTAPDIRRRIADLKARGGKLVVVDPRRTETAELADRHVFIRPGSDALFFFALLHVVFAEELERPGPHLRGIDELRTLARRFAPEKVGPAIGIAPSTITEIARELSRAPSAACYVRVGTCHNEHATLTSWLAYSLAAVTGNLDRAGGLMWTTPAIDLVRIANIGGLRGHGRFKSRVRGLPEIGGELPVAVLAEEIEAKGKGQIRALITCAGNPVLSSPNGARLDRALSSLEHIVAIDSYLNETTRHANVILPPCSPLERAHYDVALNAFAVENIAKWVDAPLARSKDARDDAEILAELAVRLRFDRAAVIGRIGGRYAPRAVVDLALRLGPYRLSIAKLKKHMPHGTSLGPLVPRLPAMLETKDKLVDLAPRAFVAEVSALETSLAKAVPELVLVGRRHLRSNNSWLHNSARLVKGPPRCTLLVHPEDARKRGLVDGERARITSARGSVEAVVGITDTMMRGVVSLPHGFGHGRAGTRTSVANANAGASMNDLTDEMRVDRLTGNAAFNATPVEVVAVQPDVRPQSRA